VQSELRESFQFAQSVVSICALVIGGAWTYYRFIRGRLFSPKIELSMKHLVVAVADPTHLAVFCEVCIKNLGSVQLVLGQASVKCLAIEGSDGLMGTRIFEKDDIIRYEGVLPEQEDTYYVDPAENTYRHFRFLAPSGPPALVASVRLMYNKVYMVDRKFVIINSPTFKAADSALVQ